MLKILLVEDNEDDAELEFLSLERGGLTFEGVRVETEEDFLTALKKEPDVILSDFSLPQFSGMGALKIAKEKAEDIPFIFVSGTIGEERAIETIREGALDYVVKSNLERLPHAVRNALKYTQEKTALKQTQKELKESEYRFRIFMDYMPGTAIMKDRDGILKFTNKGIALTWGKQPKELIGKKDIEGAPASLKEKIKETDEYVLKEKKAIQDVFEIEDKKGNIRHWLTTKFPIASTAGNDNVDLLGEIAFDITEKVKSEEIILLLSRAIEESVNPISIIDATDNKIFYANAAYEHLTGYSKDELVGKDPNFLSNDEFQTEIEKLKTSIKEGKEDHAVIKTYRKDGSFLWVDLNISPVTNSKTNKISHYIAVQYDITEIKRYQTELEHQATHDTLTNLPNRSLYQDRLRQDISRAARDKAKLYVAFLDFDNFKRINDSMGHFAGDEVIKLIGNRIAVCLRDGDTVARLGGDEFVMIMTAKKNEDIYKAMERITNSITTPFVIQDKEIRITCSIGISVFPEDGTNPEVLGRNADSAMYRAKDLGKNQIQFYAAEMNKDTAERVQLETELWGSLERKEIELYYQPQISLETGKIIGIESLLRWNHQVKGVLSPYNFISIAEENGFITLLGNWVIENACAVHNELINLGLPKIRIAINLSTRQFRTQLPTLIDDILQKYKMDPDFLEIEITESMMMKDIPTGISILKGFEKTGLKISIDDFGTGFSNLNYLKKMPVSKLKIDQGFVEDVLEDSDDASIVRAIISLAKSLNIGIIAEGVETKEQSDWLFKEGCLEGQGYYFSRPITKDKLIEFVKDNVQKILNI